MTRDGRFDQEQFERILRRAVELQAEHEERHFSEDDLLSAGRELGIRDEVTRAAARELAEPLTEVERPEGSDLELEHDPLAVRLVAPPPPRGWRLQLRLAAASIGVAAASLLSVAAVERRGQDFLSTFLALLCWSLAAPLLLRTLSEAMARTELVLRGAGGELVRRWGTVSRSVALIPHQVRFRVCAEARGPAYLELRDGDRRYRILRWRSLPELRWIEANLSAWRRVFAPSRD